MRMLLMMAARNVLQHSRRSLLVGGAIAMVMLLLTLMLGILNATHQRLQRTTTALFAGDLNVNGLFKPNPARAEPILPQAQAHADRIPTLFPGARVVPRWLGMTTVSSGTSSVEELIALGVDYSREPRLAEAVPVVAGNLADLAKPGGVVLSVERARKLKVGIGDAVILTGLNHRKVYNAVDATVVAVAANVSGGLLDWVVLASAGTVQQLFGFAPDEASMLLIHLPEQAVDLIPLQEQLRQQIEGGGVKTLDVLREPWRYKRAHLESQPWTGLRAEITRWDEEVPLQSEMLEMVNGLVALATALLMLIASAGLMNSLWLAVRERTSEIGTLRAIGMRRGKVVVLFLMEAFFLSAFGAALGSLLGVVAGELVEALNIGVPGAFQLFMGMTETLQFLTDPGATLVSAALVCLSTTAISIFPSILASRIQPVAAMQRTE